MYRSAASSTDKACCSSYLLTFATAISLTSGDVSGNMVISSPNNITPCLRSLLFCHFSLQTARIISIFHFGKFFAEFFSLPRNSLYFFIKEFLSISSFLKQKGITEHVFDSKATAFWALPLSCRSHHAQLSALLFIVLLIVPM